jgi:hypothetical protein
MPRSMGDAIHVNVPSLETAGTDMVAGYVTGSPDILWTAADWARFTVPSVTIDQGNGGPVPSADVRDVETGAWTAATAVDLTDWTTARPTIYCSLSVLPQLAAAGWQGDVWVADWILIPPPAPPPMPAGMTCVAVQYSDQGGGGTYDLSVVFDPYWPLEAPVAVPAVIAQPAWAWCKKCQGLFYGPNQVGSVCPAGGPHDGSGSGNFAMLYAQ